MISLDEKRWSGEWNFHRVVELGGVQIPRSALFFGSESWRQCFLRRQEPELHNRNGTLHALGVAYFCAIVCAYWPPLKLVCASWLQRLVYVACRAEPWQAAHITTTWRHSCSGLLLYYIATGDVWIVSIEVSCSSFVVRVVVCDSVGD